MRDRDEGNPLLAGWIGRNLAATFRHGPCIFNSTSGAWEAVGPRTAGQFVTDGSTLAGSTQPGVLTLIASGQDAKEINLPAWADDWAFWGSRLSAMAGGGYLIDSLPQLVTVSADGQLSDSPIPVGYIVSGPTSDPNVFILRRDDRKTAPERMQGPHPAYLWRKGNAAPSSLPGLVDEIVPAAAPNLTWVRDSTAAWSLVDQLGVAKLEFRSLPPWDGEPDATGKYVVEQSGRSQGCEHDVPPTCSVRLVEHATGSLLAQVNVGSNSGFFWSGSSVAFSPTTGDPVAQPAASAIVVLSPTGASQVQLPPVR